MIIDLILDRREDPSSYTQADMDYLITEAKMFEFDYIVEAFETKDNEKIQEALCQYISEQEYKSSIKDFVKSVDWTSEGFS